MAVKDIHIGPDQFIKWVEPDHSTIALLNVDHLLMPDSYFWRFLEIYCVSDCCGIDAFRFWPEDISKAIQQAEKDAFVKNLGILREEVIQSPKTAIESLKLNTYIEKSVFLKLLDHILKCLNNTGR